MDDTILVTGATGSVGSNVCAIAHASGRRVRALVRAERDAEPLARLGIETVIGDVTDREGLATAAQGMAGVIHCAAVIGGTWTTSTAADFEAVNHQGAVNVMEVAEHAGVERVVSVLSAAVCDTSFTVTERSPLIQVGPDHSPYTRSKLQAYYEGMTRAARGAHINFVIPGCIYGPSLFPKRALVPTIFTYNLVMAARGELTRYLALPLPWVVATDVANTAIAALERGRPGRRYLALGRADDVMGLPAFCNRFLELAGIERRVEELDPHAPGAASDDEFGSMVRYLKSSYPDPPHDPTETIKALGVDPTALDDGLRETIVWLRRQGEL